MSDALQILPPTRGQAERAARKAQRMAERQARALREGEDGADPGHAAALVAALGLIPPGPGIAIDLDAGSGTRERHAFADIIEKGLRAGRRRGGQRGGEQHGKRDTRTHTRDPYKVPPKRTVAGAGLEAVNPVPQSRFQCWILPEKLSALFLIVIHAHSASSRDCVSGQ